MNENAEKSNSGIIPVINKGQIRNRDMFTVITERVCVCVCVCVSYLLRCVMMYLKTW